jgi:hypothetical protein
MRREQFREDTGWIRPDAFDLGQPQLGLSFLEAFDPWHMEHDDWESFWIDLGGEG